MRNAYSLVFLLMAVTLAVCAGLAWRSRKAIGKPVAAVVASLIPPVIGNMIIISSGDRAISTLGCYVYFIGMDIVMLALTHFTLEYCGLTRLKTHYLNVVRAVMAVDSVQLLLNPLLGHAFGTEAITVDGFPYYRLIPYMGQAFHRIVDYAVIATVMLIFLYKLIRTPRIYAERYGIILIAMVAGLVWESYYIFSRTPIDRSMAGFVIFGLLAFYFSIYYRPVRLLDRMLANIASGMSEAMFFMDAGGHCVWANQPGCALMDIRDADFDPAVAHLQDRFDINLAGQDEWTVQRETVTDGALCHYVLQKRTVEDDAGRIVGAFLSVRDDTREHQELQHEKYNASHDRLTGLYNREYLYERARKMIDSHPDARCLIAFIDVKDFKLVNDIFGTEFGDYALRVIGKWIADIMPEDSVYGRLGGDTFGACLSEAAFDSEAIEASLSRFVVKKGAMEHNILIHVGVFAVTEPELDVSVMFDRAHLALSTIEREYQTHIAWYDENIRKRILWRQYISSELHDALEQGQIQPYFQPIVDGTGHTVGAEALVRWQHPVEGFLSPAAFIPVFEENGMIARIDRYMWRRACEILAEWERRGLDQFISINISPKDFYFMDVAAEIRSAVNDYGVSPDRLRLEITETVMITDMENRMRILQSLREEGFHIEMDDFGSGYSSLNLLKDMPVDVMKIDMAFLSRSRHELKAERILNNMVRMSEDIGIYSLVEGVETRDQYRMLSEMGCRLFQGYYFARPMPLKEFELKWLSDANLRARQDLARAGVNLNANPSALNSLNVTALATILLNMPALIYSKDVKTGRYLACNQMFAEYAHRQSPADVMGLTDRELYSESVAEGFMERDRITLSMNEPNVFYEDVPNAEGEVRRMRTTKLKFINVQGQECIMGMSVDVAPADQNETGECEAGEG